MVRKIKRPAPTQLGRHLQDRRVVLDISQEDVAVRMGDKKHRGYISKLESSEIEIIPSLPMLDKMAGALEETFATLVKESGLADVIELVPISELPQAKKNLFDIIRRVPSEDVELLEDLEDMVWAFLDRRRIRIARGGLSEPLDADG